MLIKIRVIMEGPGGFTIPIPEPDTLLQLLAALGTLYALRAGGRRRSR